MQKVIFLLRLFLVLLVLAGCQPAATPSSPPSSTITPTPSNLPASQTAFPTPSRPPQTAVTQTITPVPTVTGCTQPHGQIENQQVPGSPPGMGKVMVYLPPCYTPAPARRYPALYLLHGTNTDNTQWVQLGVPGVADRLIFSGQALPFIIVLPREEYYQQDPDKSVYGNWIIHTLRPWVDQTYPTCSDRACRAIGGLSRGGSWAFRIGFKDWQDFSAIGMDSAAPNSGDLDQAAAILGKIAASQQPRFYLDIGKQDGYVSLALSVVEMLTKLRVTHEWHLSDGAHNRAYWRLHVEDYLRWYTSTWQ